MVKFVGIRFLTSPFNPKSEYFLIRKFSGQSVTVEEEKKCQLLVQSSPESPPRFVEAVALLLFMKDPD